LTVRNCTFTSNTGNAAGGGISNFEGKLDVSASVFSGNNAIGGGGIFSEGVTNEQNETTMAVSSCTFVNNIGGIENTSASATINSCTITRNSKVGGIFNSTAGILTVTNSTIDSNSGWAGAGIVNSLSSLIVRNSTITHNVAQFSAGGIENDSEVFNATVVISNSTISDNTGNQIRSSRAVPELTASVELRDTIVSSVGNRPNFIVANGGQIISRGHNLSSDNGGGFLTGPADLLNTNPLLGPLQNNGGPTFTMALLPGSPAIDAGDNTDAPQFDQRGRPGFSRIVGILNPTVPIIDIGAFEVQGANQPAASSNTQDLVAQVYRDLLRREADPGGLAFFTNQLDQGMLSRFQFVLAIESSVEYRTNVVVHLYSQLLHRDPDPSGFSAWVNFLGQGGTKHQLEVSFISSQEYVIRRGGGTSSGFLQAVYQDVLGRAPDPIGLTFWNQILANGESDEDTSPSYAKRREVAASILLSMETTQDQVQRWYCQFLHRSADPIGLSALSKALPQGLADEQAIAVLVGSQEYLTRV
jgi:hypothetical protein